MGALVSTGFGLLSAGCQTLTLCVSCAGCCSNFNGNAGMSSTVVNGVYVTLLGLFMLLGYFLRSLGKKLDISLYSWRVHCSSTPHEFLHDSEPDSLNIYCQGDAAVYRLSFVLTMFFGVMAVASQVSSNLHRGLWGFKFIGLIVGLVAVMFIPNSYFDETGFAWVARIGSIFFLAIQMLLLIDFAYDWSETWIASAFPEDGGDHDKKYIFGILFVSFVLYLSVFIGIPFFFANYQNNLFISSTTLCLIIVLTLLTFLRHILSGNDELRGQLLPAAIISSYSMYLLWSALDSDVEDSENVDDYHQVKVVIGAMFAILSLMYSAYSASNSLDVFIEGSTSELDLGQHLLNESNSNYKSIESENEDYDNDFKSGDKRKALCFHLFMMCASMYMSMLLTNWGVNQYNSDEVEGVRAGNVWVKVISQWLIVFLYIVSLFAPAIFVNRDFG